MLRLDLARLERAGPRQLQVEVPPDDALWEESGLTFQGPLSVDLTAQRTASGEIILRGKLGGVLLSECRRCLEPVRTPVDEALTLVYASEDLLAEDDGEIRPLPSDAGEIDLGEAIREELILRITPFVVCDSGCRGLCPRCGVNLNQQTCACVSGELDPRWDVLRALKGE